MLSPEDFLVIYFSGHGHQGLLALYGYSEENREEALYESDLKELLSQMPTENITLIVDACNSGSLLMEPSRLVLSKRPTTSFWRRRNRTRTPISMPMTAVWGTSPSIFTRAPEPQG